MMPFTQLVDIRVALPQVRIDLKYATADNITGQAIYRENRCLLHPDAAAVLVRSVHIAQLAGFTLLVYDAYRPQQAQQNLWLSCSDPDYVTPPGQGSNHCRGTAVDVTLVDHENKVVDMGSGFDEMHPHSHAYHPAMSAQAQRHRLLLNGIMFGGGFCGIATEWWHFELPQAASYALLPEQFDCYPPASGG